jgi:DNA-binding response OmpR family regulator
VIEDDVRLCDAIADELNHAGYTVEKANGEAEVTPLLAGRGFDLVTLDLNLDGMPYKGLDLVRAIRTARNVPIIAITAHTAPWDRLRALELGIDDYVTKPFLMGEILIRIERALSRYAPEPGVAGPGQPHAVFRFAGYQLDTTRRELMAPDGGRIELTETELNLLCLLVRSPSRIMTRDELWQSLRGHAWSPLDRTLDGHIARLRRKLEPAAERPELIKSVRGIGYVLAVPVTSTPD